MTAIRCGLRLMRAPTSSPSFDDDSAFDRRIGKRCLLKDAVGFRFERSVPTTGALAKRALPTPEVTEY